MGFFQNILRAFKRDAPPKSAPRQWIPSELTALEEQARIFPSQEGLPLLTPEQTASSPILDRYKPVPIGEGGEQIVYRVAGIMRNTPEKKVPIQTQERLKQVVVKLDKISAGRLLAQNAEAGVPLDADSDAVRAFRESQLARERERFRQLKEAFGTEHVLVQKRYLQKMPITPPMRARILEDVLLFDEKTGRFRDDDTLRVQKIVDQAAPKEVWGMVTVQRKSEALATTSKIGCIGMNVERNANNYEAYAMIAENPELAKMYREITDPLLNAETTAATDVHPVAFADFINHRSVERLIDKVFVDPELQAVLKDFCERAAAYTNATGELLDLEGEDNIIFYKKQNQAGAEEWTYQLVDALSTGGDLLKGPDGTMIRGGIAQGREAYARNQPGVRMDQVDRWMLSRAVNYTRLINGLGQIVGSTQFVDFLPAKRDKDVLKLLFPNAPDASPSSSAGIAHEGRGAKKEPDAFEPADTELPKVA